MSTRSTYRVRERFIDEKKNKPVIKDLVLMYIQCDGYPSGHPVDTAEWLSKARVVNGIGMNDHEGVVFNGAGCLAASLVAKYKNGIGSAYLHSLKDRGNSGEDYTYDILVDYDKEYKPTGITFIAYECHWAGPDRRSRIKQIFEGTPAEFVKWVKEKKDESN